MVMRRSGVIGAVLVLVAMSPSYGAESLEFSPVVRESVERVEVADALLEAVQQATLSAQTSGRIVAVNFDVDDYVEKNSILVRFRDKEQKAALNAARAQASEAEASYARIKDLFSKKTVSQADLDRAEAAVKSARAQLERAQEQMEYTVVRAPYSGIVVKRHVEVGETANPGQPLMTGISLERLRAVANIPQRYVDIVRRTRNADVVLDVDGRKALKADQVTVSPFADEASHTFRVRLDLPPGQHGLYPGMFAKARFVVGSEERLVVDARSVVQRSEVTAVYVHYPDGHLGFRQIRIGRQLANGKVEVLAGLSEGEQVATDPIRAGVVLKQRPEGQ